jgi:tRNA threonylcarbamoyladenosine biosynthesis protein TsaB
MAQMILAFDTALASCSVALYDSNERRSLADEQAFMEVGQAEALGPMVRRVMARAGSAFDQVERIAVTVGPGTFTGLRIGLSFALGLGMTLKRPIVGLTTLEAIAANVPPGQRRRPVAAAIDARRGNLYFQLFSSGLEALTPPLVLTPGEAASRLPAGGADVVGTGAAVLAGTAGEPAIARLERAQVPDARVLAALAAERPLTGRPPEPLYLRPPAARSLPRDEAPAAKIVSAGSEHAGILAALHGECFDPAWDPMAFAKLMVMPGAVALIASTPDGEPAGFVMARHASDEAEILTIGVRPLARRRNLATRLIRDVAGRLAASGARRLLIEVAQGNAAALSLYAKLGFSQVGVRRNYYGSAKGNDRHAVTMTLPLPIA